ncbi:pulmonary surfactant-associated protein D-like [Leptodactylus fuscus]
MVGQGTESDTSLACSVIQGLPGLNGRDGRDGINGLKGDPGPPGEPGAPGLRGSIGPSGKEGPKGNIGLTGLPGQKGNSGEQGLQGLKGEKGDNSGQSATLTNALSKLSSLETELNQLKKSISSKMKALLFARGATAGEKTFVTSGKELTYEESKAMCLKAGGQLPLPRNSEENKAILDIVQYYNLHVYLGITDIQTEGVFQYPDGKTLTYSNWNTNEPNQQGDEDCVEMQLSGKWNDRACKDKRLNICEFS